MHADAPLNGNAPAQPPSALELRHVSKTFGTTKAVDSVSLSIRVGEMTALIGPSGSGKSTLMQLCNGLLGSDPVSGSFVKSGSDTLQSAGKLSPRIRKARARIGFIFQRFNLVGRLSLLSNALVGQSSRTPLWRNLFLLHRHADRREAMRALRQVGLAAFAAQRASTLSGGQQQRGAIARAIVQQAGLVLADEPIASLDPRSAEDVMKLLFQLNERDGVTVLVSLHQVDVAKRYCRRVVALKDGRIHYDGPPEELDAQTLRSIYGDSDFLSKELEPCATPSFRDTIYASR